MSAARGADEQARRYALEVSGLCYRYPDGHEALRGLDLRVRVGERVAILGPNGAGKSTLVLHLNGILSPQAGLVRVGDLPVQKPHLAEVRRRVGVVFQDPDDQMFCPTVAEDVAFGPANLGLRGAELAARVAEALAQVGLSGVADRPPQHLSLGQRRRAALATVLAMRPDVLVLDEPSANLDPAARRELADLLTGLALTLLVVTHDLPYAAELCSRAVIVDAGRVVADGATGALLADGALLAAHRLECPTTLCLRCRQPTRAGAGASQGTGR